MDETAEPLSEVSVLLEGFRTVRFGMNSPAGLQLDHDSVQFRFMVKADFVVEEEVVAIHLGVLVGTEESPPGIGFIDTATVFRVEGLKGMETGPATVTMDDGVMTTLLGLAYSTTRGALVTRGAGTALERFPLPIYDAGDLLRQLKRSQAADAESDSEEQGTSEEDRVPPAPSG